MSVTDKLRALMELSGVKGVDLSEALGVSYNSASNRMYKGVKRIDDLIKICDKCAAKISISSQRRYSYTANHRRHRENKK